ncbi:MAG TPA: ATP synthase F1 subunit epsilon [Candidatus Avimonas sp.]|nr:ATP synthase F1 subunit epsilon [Clostridiales bacterium]HPU57929.1 ATP synthase F1 subunit epsilon [Candidatus Avimonas sp.]
MIKTQKDIDKKLTLTITTPRGIKFVEKADLVVMRCIDGDLGVMPGHAPLSAVLGDGILRIFNNGVVSKLAVFGGVVDIRDRTVNIFTTIAQRPEEIDRERAERDKREAEELLEKSEEKQSRKLQVLLQRSLVRIEVSSHLDDTSYYDSEEEEKE